MLNRTFGCVRVVWNRTLAWRRRRHQEDKTGTTFAQANGDLTAMKATEELAWLNEVSSVPLQQTIRHQPAAYTAFFAKRARYPRFKSRNGRQSAEYTRSGFRWRDGRLFLAKMDAPLAFTWSWPGIDPATVDPTTVMVSRDPCGRWYVAFAVDVPDPDPLPATGRVAGVDLGVTDFAVTSDGQRITNPGQLERLARTLARYQRRLARCQPGSANRAKARAKAARAHRKVRADFLHRTSTSLVRHHDVIVLEDLAVKNMVRNRRLAKAISDSACGYLLASLSLNTRTRQCPSCGTRHDRDHNAAKNILAAGRAVAGDTPGHACGADVRHSWSSRVQSAVKQEPRPVRAGIPVHQGGE